MSWAALVAKPIQISIPYDRFLQHFIYSLGTVAPMLVLNVSLDRGNIISPNCCGAVSFLLFEVKKGFLAHLARTGAGPTVLWLA